MTGPELIEAALKGTPDFSTRFTAMVMALADDIRRSCSVAVVHETSMNYSAAQRLKWEGTDPDRRVRIDVLVSSRGPLFTRLVYSRGAAGEWHRTRDAVLPPQAERLWACVSNLLSRHGLVFMPETDLEGPAPGFVTEMDGVPASLLDVLFTELA
jgi:hypothetical protein